MAWRKKALSEVVVTIAIALLTVGAVTVIAAFVVPFVRDNLNTSTECVAYKDYFTFYEDFGYNCYEGTLYGVSVKAGNLGESEDEETTLAKNVKGFKLVFSTANGESVPVKVFAGNTVSSGEEGMRMLNSSLTTLEIPGPRGAKTYIYNNTLRFNRLAVYTVLSNDRLCEEESDSINIEGEICEVSLT